MQSGFSLAEMLVVLAILSVCMAVAAPRFNNGGSAALRQSATEIAALLRAARTEAVLKGDEALVTVDLDRKHVTASWTDRELTLPQDATVQVLTARQEVIATNEASFRFFPDGSATGGEIRLRLAKTGQTIGIDWLTGRVERTAGDPQ